MVQDILTSQLPVELVIDIFLRILPPKNRKDWTDTSPPHATMSPFLLSSVCPSWRTIIFSTPELWIFLNLTLHERHYVTQVELLRLWIANSGSHPLEIVLRGPGGDDEEYWELHPPHEVFEELIKVSERWKTADIFVPYPCYASLSYIQHRLPLLQSLHIRPPDGIDAEFDYKLSFFSSCPRLTFLNLSNIYFQDALTLPFAQLRTLEGIDFLVEECYTMLARAAPSLETCRFASIHQSSDFAYPSRETITLPHLHTLSLSSLGNMLATVFLYSLLTPSLTSLSLSLGFSFDDWEPFSFRSITSLVERCGCGKTLKYLKLVNVRLVEQELMTCLSVLPELEELHLHVEYPKSTAGMALSDIFMSGLIPPHLRLRGVPADLRWPSSHHRPQSPQEEVNYDAPLIVPKLRVFEYSGPLRHISDHAIRTMLECRWRGLSFNTPSPQMKSSTLTLGSQPSIASETKLERCIIESASSIDFSPSTKAALRALFEDGMELVLTNGYTSWIHDNWIPVSNIVKWARKYRARARAAEGKTDLPSRFQLPNTNANIPAEGAGSAVSDLQSVEENAPTNPDNSAKGKGKEIEVPSPSSSSPSLTGLPYTTEPDLTDSEDWIPNRHLGRYTYHYPLVPPQVHPYSTSSPGTFVEHHLSSIRPPSSNSNPNAKTNDGPSAAPISGSNPEFIPSAFIEGFSHDNDWSEMTRR